MKKMAAVAVLAAAPLLAACSAGPAPPPPQSAAQVARQAGATGFTDCGKIRSDSGAWTAAAGLAADAGTAYVHGKRTVIATFPSSGQRDTWVAKVASFGIVPSQEGATWVLYTATDQAAKGCG
ncbi:MAG TPA: hypothetical protein VK817_00765 [Trebonia sp.]|nr:hypothetical protein [Trebonia sp.]